MRVEFETNKKEATAIAPFLITILFQLSVRIGVLTNYDSTTNHIYKDC